MPTKTKNRLSGLSGLGGEAPTNGAADLVEMQRPYVIEMELTGICPILFRRWNCEEYEQKQKAKKGSDVRKRDLPENCIFRNEQGNLCIPTEYVRQSIINAAKSYTDPRSAKKQAKELFAAALSAEQELNEILVDGKPVKDWQYLDKRRCRVNHQGVNRVRPAFHSGWKLIVRIRVNVPEYIGEPFLHTVVNDAARLCGLADFRPSYGRYQVTRFTRLELK